jgi:hypothetical protein
VKFPSDMEASYASGEDWRKGDLRLRGGGWEKQIPRFARDDKNSLRFAEERDDIRVPRRV